MSLIDRQAALMCLTGDITGMDIEDYIKMVEERVKALPTAQPDYQEVLGWLLAYHAMSFNLHGPYPPHNVISWLINDFAKAFIAERRRDE